MRERSDCEEEMGTYDSKKEAPVKASMAKLWIILPTALVFLISAPLRADDGVGPWDGTIDVTSNLRVGNFETTPLPDNDPVYDVLWDLTHGVYLDYEPTGWHSDLVAALAANGYVTTTTAAGVHNIDLSSYEIIVIALVSAWDSPYTTPEVQAIQDFMSLGGAVLVMGENTDCPNGNINPVTQNFGVTCGVSFPSPNDLYLTDFAPHQIFDGVTTVYYRAAGEISASDPGIPIAWTDLGEAMIASVGPCQMIVTGDCNFCENDHLGTADNLQFAMNVFDCLATGSSPVEGSTWGAIKALYR